MWKQIFFTSIRQCLSVDIPTHSLSYDMYGRYAPLTAKRPQAGSGLINDALSRRLSPPNMISNQDPEAKTRQTYIISIAVLIL